MATVEEKPSTEQEPSGVFKGFYKAFRDASEQVSLTAVNLPAMFLEGIGVPEEKTQGLKDMNKKFVGGVYGASDWMVDKVGGLFTAPFRLIGGAVEKVRGRKPEVEEAAEAVVEKAEAVAPKKAAKKAPEAKKEPPKVAAKKPEPAKEEAKEAA